MAKSQRVSNVPNAPAFAAYANVATSLASGANTKVNFQVEDFDTNSNFASSRFTPSVAGYYQINGRVQFDGTATAPIAYIFKNGADNISGNYIPGSHGYPVVTVSGLVYLNGSTDYVEIYAAHSTGSAMDTRVTTASATRFDGVLVRPA